MPAMVIPAKDFSVWPGCSGFLRRIASGVAHPQVTNSTRDYLALKLRKLEHEVFAVLFLGGLQHITETLSTGRSSVVILPPMATEPIAVHEYDPSWPDRYAKIAARIREALGILMLRVEHIGSTSVPGLAAKPIIDLDVVV